MICSQRPRNLKDHLVQAKLCKVEETTGGMFKCGKKRCQVCDSIVVSATFQSTVQGRTFRINHRFDCDSRGVVYLITCKQRKKQNVGSTVTPFRLRFNNHKSSLDRFGRGHKEICGQHLYAHFLGGAFWIKGFFAQVIDVTDLNKATERESFWIGKLKYYVPRGLNVREES